MPQRRWAKPVAPSKYPSNPEIPIHDPNVAMLYGMITETRRDLLERIDYTGEENRRGVAEIKQLLSDGKETFGRHDERLKNTENGINTLGRRIDDVESDVQKAVRNPSGLNRSLKQPDESSGARNAVNKDLRVKLFNTLVIAAVAAVGSGIGALILNRLSTPPPQTTSSTTTSTSTSKP